jgi:hypothetical protein
MILRHLLSLLAVSLILSARPCHAGSSTDPALDLMATGITLTDEAFSYCFANDGTFQCSPLGLSGPTLDGRWAIEAHSGKSVVQVVVVAKCGWANGLSSTDSYRRIVFFIGAGETLPLKGSSTGSGTSPREHYKCHWSIAEMKPTPAPPFAENSRWLVATDPVVLREP